MSVVLDSSGNEYLSTSTQPFTTKPITMSAWFKSTTVAANGVVVGLTDNNHEFLITQARGTETGDPVAALEYATAWKWASSSTSYSADTWHHLAAVYVSATERTAFLDGGGKITNTDSQDVSFTALDEIYVGSHKSSSGFFDGKIAEVAIWSAELSDAQILSLANGAVAVGIDDDNLKVYWKLLNNYLDTSGQNNTLSVGNGSPSFSTTDHPPVINYPETNLSSTLRLVVAGNDNIYYESI